MNADLKRRLGIGMGSMTDRLKQFRDPFEPAPVEKPLDEPQVTILDWDIDGIVTNWIRSH